jgi:prevent-host-death family protein
MHSWQLQEAKNKFSQVVDEAISDGPQIITRHGNSVAVVLSYAEFIKLQSKKEPLSKFFGIVSLEGVIPERDRSPLRKNNEFSS